MEVKYGVMAIQIITTMIAVVVVSILFLYTIKNIEMQTSISESAQTRKVKDAVY
jgi:competence protein ComGC